MESAALLFCLMSMFGLVLISLLFIVDDGIDKVLEFLKERRDKDNG